MNEEGARRVARAFLMAGILLVVVNHLSAVRDGEVYVFALVLGPTAVLLGVGGVLNPQILLAAGKHGTHLPQRLRVLAVLLVVAGLATSTVLALVVYQIHRGPARWERGR